MRLLPFCKRSLTKREKNIQTEKLCALALLKMPKPLKGLKIVADCANGATSVVAPEALRRAGADVIVINASPDGYNINVLEEVLVDASRI